MPNEDYMQEIREFYEKFGQQSASAWELHQDFYRELAERHTSVFNAIMEERLASLKQLPEIETPTQLFDLGLELEKSARERLMQLYTDNTTAMERHYRDLAALYAPEKPPAKQKAAKAAA